jgi:hypothetical protein
MIPSEMMCCNETSDMSRSRQRLLEVSLTRVRSLGSSSASYNLFPHALEEDLLSEDTEAPGL